MTYEEFLSIVEHRINPAIGRIRMDDHQGTPYNGEHIEKAYRKLFEDFGHLKETS